MAICLTPREASALNELFDKYPVPRELIRLKRVLKGQAKFPQVKSK